MRRAKTHLWLEGPIAWFGLAFQFILGRGKHQIARLTNRAEKIERLKNRLDDNDRRGELSRCHQGGATSVVAAVMRMRIARFAVRVFRSFGFWRVVAVVMSDRLGSVCFRVVMIAPEQVLDAAIRRRQQPKHDAACRYNAEADVDFWLPRNHTLNLLFIIPCRGGRADTALRRPAGKTHIIFSPFLSSPYLWLHQCRVWSRSRRQSRRRTSRNCA